MSDSTAGVRILVVQRSASQALRSALERLGSEVSVERVERPDACIERARGGEFDLVVVDREFGHEAFEILEALRGIGPPIIVATTPGRDDLALEWFRRGAADCVSVGDESGEALAVAALEQLRLWRAARERRAADRRAAQTARLASIGQLAAGVAHEINNPAGFIHANLLQMAEYVTDLQRVWESVDTVVRCQTHGNDDERRAAAEALAKISEEVDAPFLMSDLLKAIQESQEGSQRIRDIVQDLKLFARDEHTDPTWTDVNECLDSTANMVWGMMKHSVVLEKDYGEVPRILAYPSRLKQVFMNLLVNAYQAVAERVGSSGEIGSIQLRSFVRNDGVAIVVEDDGVGIAPENLTRVFDPFFTTKEVGLGTGLGLSTAHSVVQRHGGYIQGDSQPGKGTTFEVWLPIRTPEGEA